MKLVRVVLDLQEPEGDRPSPESRITAQLVLDAADRMDHHSGIAFGFIGSLKQPAIRPFVIQGNELRFSPNDHSDARWNLADRIVRQGELVTLDTDGHAATYEITQIAPLLGG